jgi:hypothetical protein
MNIGGQLVFVATVSKHMKTMAVVYEPVEDRDLDDWEDIYELLSCVYFKACDVNDELPDYSESSHIDFSYNQGKLQGHKVTPEREGKIIARYDINLQYGLKIGEKVFKLDQII